MVLPAILALDDHPEVLDQLREDLIDPPRRPAVRQRPGTAPVINADQIDGSDVTDLGGVSALRVPPGGTDAPTNPSAAAS